MAAFLSCQCLLVISMVTARAIAVNVPEKPHVQVREQVGCYSANKSPQLYSFYSKDCVTTCADDGYPFALQTGMKCSCALKFNENEHLNTQKGAKVNNITCVYKTENPSSEDMLKYIGHLEHIIEDNDSFAAFTALSSGNPAINPGKVLIFDQVLTNRGNAYDSKTGYFTCPTPGLYMFSIHLESNKGDHANLYVMKDNQTLIRVAAWPLDDFHSGSNSVIVSCSQGQKVYPKGVSQGRLSCCLTSSFSGFFIKA